MKRKEPRPHAHFARPQEYFKKNGEPLFSSHMLDLSEEVDEENIATCKAYLERMATMKVGGWVDGCDVSICGLADMDGKSFSEI